jgi:hypothetical protein
MDGQRFDSLARKLGARADRRTVVRGFTGGALAAVGIGALSSEASAKGEKALICHYTSSTTNPYNIIEVSANAVAAHEAHGDHLAFDCGNGPQCTACFPDACTAGTVGVISGDPWTVCRADADSAWLSAATLGEYDALAACQSLGYSSFGQYGGNCGSICGYCESGTSCDNPGTEVYDGQGLGNCGAGVLCFTVTWECLA